MDRISSNNLAKLIGEFIVIVAGVLLALAADRWNQDRAGQERADSYHARLESELVADLSRLSEERDGAESSMISTDSLLAQIQGETKGTDNTYELYFSCARNAPMPYAGGATFQEIKSAGDLGLLDESLRQALFDYYGFVEGQLLRIQDMRRIGRDPITEVAFRVGAWLPDNSRLSDDELLQSFREYPEIEEIVRSCAAFHRTTGNQIGQWMDQLSLLLELVRNTNGQRAAPF